MLFIFWLGVTLYLFMAQWESHREAVGREWKNKMAGFTFRILPDGRMQGKINAIESIDLESLLSFPKYHDKFFDPLVISFHPTRTPQLIFEYITARKHFAAKNESPFPLSDLFTVLSCWFLWIEKKDGSHRLVTFCTDKKCRYSNRADIAKNKVCREEDTRHSKSSVLAMVHMHYFDSLDEFNQLFFASLSNPSQYFALLFFHNNILWTRLWFTMWGFKWQERHLETSWVNLFAKQLNLK